MKGFEFERAAGLRAWIVFSQSNDLQNGFRFKQLDGDKSRLEITDGLIRILYSNLPHKGESK